MSEKGAERLAKGSLSDADLLRATGLQSSRGEEIPKILKLRRRLHDVYFAYILKER